VTSREEIIAPCEDSMLTSIADISSIDQTLSGRESPEDNTLSEHGTICDNTRELSQEQEQSYNTASASEGPSVGPTIFSTPFSEVPTDKGKQRATSISHQSEAFTSSLRMREVPPHLSYNEED
jgi:hypothetical protein